MEIWDANNSGLYTISKLVSKANEILQAKAKINVYFVKYLIRIKKLERKDSIFINGRNVGIYSLDEFLGIYAPLTDGYHFNLDDNDKIIVPINIISLMAERTNQEKAFEAERKKKAEEIKNDEYRQNVEIRKRYDTNESKNYKFKNILLECYQKISKNS